MVSITQLKDSGGVNNGGDDTNSALSANSTITILAVNDAPVLTATSSNPTFIQGDGAVSLFTNSSAGTIESGQNISEMVITITNVTDGNNEVLNIDGTSIELSDSNSGTTTTNTLSYSVALTGTTATLTLTGGSMSTGEVQTMIDGCSYQNNLDWPTINNRVVTITQLTDNGGTDNGGIKTASLNLQSTAAVKIHTSQGSTSWSATETWNFGTVPNANNNVIISAGDVVTASSSTTINHLMIEETGQVQIDGNSTILTINETLTYDDNNALSFSNSGSILLKGNILNKDGKIMLINETINGLEIWSNFEIEQ
ncbi:lipoprotein receptor-related protein [Candidatus Magnetomorum sp. HK-1]|nr:lipoprotein receptor-related protein [Candidatus Magnetomorum sp. HK-1]